MTPEAPSPLPIPEIVQSPEYPPTLLDLEIHPPAFVDLLTTLQQGQHFYLDRICITEGLTTTTLDESGIPVLSETQTLRDKAPEEAMQMFFEKLEAGRRPIFGEYFIWKDAHIYPDTIFLFHLDRIARIAKDIIPSRIFKPDTLIQTIMYRSGVTLLHELEHSFQLKLMMYPPPSTPRDLLHHCLEQWAQSKILDPQLADLAYRAFTARLLISDQQLLKLYYIASDRYRRLKT